MNNYDFEQEFIDAVSNNDVPYLRTFIASEIRVDPAFNKSKCDDCMKYIRERGINITEPLKRNINEREVPADSSQWTKELFHDKVEDLRQNFAYSERIGEIKKVGRVAYADKIKKEAPKPSFAEAPKGRRSSTEKTSPLMIFGAIAAAVVVIVAIVLLFKK